MAPGSWLGQRFSGLARLFLPNKTRQPAQSASSATTTKMGSVNSNETQASSKPFNVQKVAIVGAGPSGLAAAKYLLAQSQSSSTKCFSRIQILEQQAQVGGVWYYSATPSETLHMPQTSAFCAPDPPLKHERTSDGRPMFPSPVYEELNTNIPHTIMRFSDGEFEGSDLIFPTRERVQEYLVTYAEEVRGLVRFSTMVVDVKLRTEEGRDQWDVTTRNLLTEQETMETFDAVVVASGHYNVTYVPDINGIREYNTAHPGALWHSKLYRTPDVYKGKKVLIVGNSASGLDIAVQTKKFCQQPLYVSARTPTPSEARDAVGFEEVAEIEEFLVEERGVKLKDGSVLTGLDAVLFCTGYLFTLPFLETMDPPLVTDGRKVCGLYKHLMHIRHPTLVFPVLPIKVIPFPMAEVQAAFFTKVWANEMALPSREEMEKWERDEAERKGAKFHVFPKGGDGEYINAMHDWVMQEGNGKTSKEPPRWDKELMWEREIYAEARREFEKTGKKALTLAELGFHYEPEKSPAR